MVVHIVQTTDRDVPVGTLLVSLAYIYSTSSCHSPYFFFFLSCRSDNSNSLFLACHSFFFPVLYYFDMNPLEEQITSQDMLLLRSLLGRIGGQLTQATPSTPAPTSIPAPPGPYQFIPIQPSQAPSAASATQPVERLTQSMPLAPIPNNGPGILQLPNRYPAFPLHPASGHPSLPPVITPYHSALPGPQGHPPRSTRISSTVENMGSSITSQVNQQRLAAAAVNLPSQVSLPQRTARRRRRGQAISPPTLTTTFSINSVLSNDGSSPLIRIKVKVYPPQVSTSISSSLSIHLN
jgi:hypothetical protein